MTMHIMFLQQHCNVIGENIPNLHKLYQMFMKYMYQTSKKSTDIFHSRASCVKHTKIWYFWYANTIWQPWSVRLLVRFRISSPPSCRIDANRISEFSNYRFLLVRMKGPFTLVSCSTQGLGSMLQNSVSAEKFSDYFSS
jgi:hypothetical protein